MCVICIELESAICAASELGLKDVVSRLRTISPQFKDVIQFHPSKDQILAELPRRIKYIK